MKTDGIIEGILIFSTFTGGIAAIALGIINLQSGVISPRLGAYLWDLVNLGLLIVALGIILIIFSLLSRFTKKRVFGICAVSLNTLMMILFGFPSLTLLPILALYGIGNQLVTIGLSFSLFGNFWFLKPKLKIAIPFTILVIVISFLIEYLYNTFIL